MLLSLDPSGCPIVKVIIACDERECNDQGLSGLTEDPDLRGSGGVVECYTGGWSKTGQNSTCWGEVHKIVCALKCALG